jgi:hypothetical protein
MLRIDSIEIEINERWTTKNPLSDPINTIVQSIWVLLGLARSKAVRASAN